jgi:hypothetical protein
MTASTAPSRTAAHRNGFGLSSLGLGVAGILIGVFAGGAWFVVVPAGLLTLILGIVGVTQKRYYAASDVSAAVVGVVAGAVALALGVVGTGTFLDGLYQTSVGAPAGPSITGSTIAWGQAHDIGHNVVVTVSAPVAFASSSGTTRSVVLSVTITNHGVSPYHPNRSVYLPSATFDGQSLRPIAFPAPPSDTIAPGGQVGYRVAYGLPNHRGELRLTLRPNPNAPLAVIGGPA